MKSPTNSVGIIDPDGIRKGSNKNDRSIRTAINTGKKALEYSMRSGSFLALLTAGCCRRRENRSTSASHNTPVTTVRINKINSKSKPEPKLPIQYAPAVCKTVN
jgi:hypothetical protein